MHYVQSYAYTCSYVYCYHIGFSWKALEAWKEYLWLGIPGMAVIGSEWLAYEIGSFVSGSVDSVQLAAFTITLNITAICFVVSI